ncbi:hypothetical protein GW15_0209270 [Xanthomonas axonopodis pv. vasculorum]|uniref:Uncharacterized protein n=1 Tax=Xanthomonas axonopodis pv. vasculorum TaxID=325777 RepID=A0A098Q0J2_9XANT|nr:hypothetical protein GW15_0209270 [Xanthomonas axonopodis pv. vasculorum]
MDGDGYVGDCTWRQPALALVVDLDLAFCRSARRSAVDHVGHGLGLGDEQRVASGHGGDVRADSLGHVQQHGLIEGLVFGSDHGPARLALPGSVLQALAERGHLDRHLGGRHERSIGVAEIIALKLAGRTKPKPSERVSITHSGVGAKP